MSAYMFRRLKEKKSKELKLEATQKKKSTKKPKK